MIYTKIRAARLLFLAEVYSIRIQMSIQFNIYKLKVVIQIKTVPL